ncbi:hypothetical protein E6W39_13500 [Kitasatospora acidiphila]|uniref:DUF4241 domain-containing protein n=1 Tax=Kitasatospora acidiphila TaxID=2567942 RepID=A0A540W410_9ACTN|nr:hypothetical protein [Kitasatospora acidiphila]TQF03084.1 hypothetical protein E6W39_13500 [Kitasatospora acidiphila]
MDAADVDTAAALERIATLFNEFQMGDWPYQGRAHGFHRVSDLVVTGTLVFAQPNPGEWIPYETLAPGSYPVYLEVIEEPDPAARVPLDLKPSWTFRIVIPLAAPEAIAEAAAARRIELVYNDYQPLGPLGALWDQESNYPADRTPEFVQRIEADLAAGAEAGRVPNVAEIPADSGGGAKYLAFYAPYGSALAWELADADGEPVCLVMEGAD